MNTTFILFVSASLEFAKKERKWVVSKCMDKANESCWIND